ncbi:MAG: hypothetical protein ACRDRS_12325 [Pseudonocardiaceae bacterium]
MSTPLLADALGLLRNDLCVHLDEAEYLADEDREWSEEDMDQARRLIRDLVLALRGLLIEHRRQPRGECKVCSVAWPCPVVTSVHDVVKDPEREFVAIVRRSRGDA